LIDIFAMLLKKNSLTVSLMLIINQSKIIEVSKFPKNKKVPVKKEREKVESSFVREGPFIFN